MKSGYMVRDFMNHRPVICSENDTLAKVCKLMHDHALSSLIVRENDKLVSKDKIIEAFGKGKTENTKIKDADVYRTMYCCEPDIDLVDALELIIKNKSRRLCVKEKGKVTGIISMKDIFLVVPTIFEKMEYAEVMRKTRFGEGEEYRVLKK